MNGQLYAFRLSSSAPLWVLVGDKRAWLQNGTIAAQHQVDPAGAAIVAATSPLWTLPTTGQVP